MLLSSFDMRPRFNVRGSSPRQTHVSVRSNVETSLPLCLSLSVFAYHSLAAACSIATPSACAVVTKPPLQKSVRLVPFLSLWL